MHGGCLASGARALDSAYSQVSIYHPSNISVFLSYLWQA